MEEWRFHRIRNREKAAMGLYGLCCGINSDRQLTHEEILYLEAWLRNQPHASNDPDAQDILDIITDILSDGIITTEESDDLREAIATVVDFRHMEADESERHTINRLLGILEGITADNRLADREIMYLHQWLEDNPEAINRWPASEIAPAIDKILSDGTITEDERTWLLDLLKGCCGNQFHETGIAASLAATGFVDDNPPSSIDGHNIVLTGNFLLGPRSAVMRCCESLGASVKKNVSRKCDLVIVGSVLSRDWLYSTHGTKVRKALELKAAGAAISILHEDHLHSIIKNR